MNPRSKTIALVTGATGGLGTAMCQKLYQDGYTVVANYRNEQKGTEWHSRNKELGFDFNMVQGDVTDFEDMRRMMEEIKAKFGGVSILINNAGITRDTPLWKMSLTQWHEVISSNLDSVFNCTRHVIEDMIEQKFGRIINISSVNGQRGQFGQTNYSSAKAGMHGFTKSLAMEVAKKGITVNTISPGYIGTDMVMAIREEVRNKIVEQIPMGRLGGTEEIAHLVSFLASEKAAYITGANYAINGGQHVY
ncbi:MAG: acetoacetyl-CoA reductase [Saprospiraceae bacterium]|jgi:acetoacetyl-CoA reductase|nr:acetoacetyl-CoA reductase [Saprospiraceae bacterium]MCI1266919.1 acetoacetyl-CoA reductase [Saprospiraceae bacterium]